MMLPVYSLQDFESVLHDSWNYPFYGIILYTPMNGLDGRIHEYIVNRWGFMNSLTGSSCLLLAVEDLKRGLDITEFKPEDVYDIARMFGASVSVGDLPCIVFFTEPETRRETCVIKLRQFLPTPADATDDDLTDFFRGMASIVDACSGPNANQRLTCLEDGLRHNWPADSTWFQRVSHSMGAIVASLAGAATIVKAVSDILTTLAPLFKGGS